MITKELIKFDTIMLLIIFLCFTIAHVSLNISIKFLNDVTVHVCFLENGAIILYDNKEFIKFKILLLYLRMSEKKVLRSPELTVASFCTDLASGVAFSE